MIANPQAKIKKVLFIDDDKVIINLYQMAFSKRKDYRFLVAEDCQKGYQLAKKEQPDLILLDLVFPKEEGLVEEGTIQPIKIKTHAGYQLLEQLKKDEQTKDIPVVILTNLAKGDEDEVRTRQLGAMDYWLKAEFVPRQIIEKVDQILKKNLDVLGDGWSKCSL